MDEFFCPVCKTGKMIWDSEEDAEDIGCPQEGIFVFYHCDRCDVQVEIFIPKDLEDDNL